MISRAAQAQRMLLLALTSLACLMPACTKVNPVGQAHFVGKVTSTEKHFDAEFLMSVDSYSFYETDMLCVHLDKLDDPPKLAVGDKIKVWLGDGFILASNPPQAFAIRIEVIEP